MLHQSFGRTFSIAHRIFQHAAQFSRRKPLPKHGHRRQRPLRRPGSPRSEIIAIVVAIAATHGAYAMAVSATNHMWNVHSAAIFLQRRIQLVTIQTARMLKYCNNLSPSCQALARACTLRLAPNRAAGAELDKKDDQQLGPGTQYSICPVEVSVCHIAERFDLNFADIVA